MRSALLLLLVGSSAFAQDVKLIDAGKAPRRAFAYHLAAGTTETMTSKVSAVVDMTIGGNPQHIENPPITMTNLIHVVSAGADGAQLETEISSVEGASSKLPSLAGTKYHSTLGPHGEVDITDGTSANPLMQSFLSSLKNQLENPIPTQPIGVGARWQYRAHPEMMGMKMSVVGNYELVSVDGDKLGVHVQMMLLDVDATGLAKKLGSDVKLDVSGGGEADMVLDLTQPSPETSMFMNIAFQTTIKGISFSGSTVMKTEMHPSSPP